MEGVQISAPVTRFRTMCPMALALSAASCLLSVASPTASARRTCASWHSRRDTSLDFGSPPHSGPSRGGATEQVRAKALLQEKAEVRSINRPALVLRWLRSVVRCDARYHACLRTARR